MRNNGNGSGNNSNQGNNGKPQLFRSLEANNADQNSLLGIHAPSNVSRSHQAARTSAQAVDFFLALYILALQLPLTR